MATDSFKVKKSLNIEPIAGASPTVEGDITYDLTAHKASLHNGTTASPVVTEAHSATFTNKTFDADGTGNSITNIENADIKAAAAIDATKIADGSVTNTEFQYISTVTSNVQTQLDSKVDESVLTTTGDMIYASSANTPARLGIGASNQVLKVVGGVPTWAAAPSGGVNYLASANDGDAIGAWTTYDDGASSTPVDGTGGSPGVTHAVSTNSDLRGTTNFLFTHDAADRQGEGFSFDFTIDAADKYSVLQCSFDYLVASGTYADDDLQFWVYDVTNAALIQPAPYKLKNASIAQKFAFEFQTTSSTSYRLIAHVSTTTATAYTIRFDNWNLGPQAKLYGSPVTDWVSYTPTITGFGTPTSVEFQYRRVGDVCEIQGKFTSGTSTAVEARLGLPSGLSSASTSKIPSIMSCGYGVYSLAAASQVVPLIEPSVSYLTMGIQAAGTAGLTKQNGSAIFSSGQTYSFFAFVPITGWSSSVIMSNDAATNVVSLYANRTSSLSLSTGVTADMIYDSSSNATRKEGDTTGSYNTSTGIYTVPVPGWYQIDALVDAYVASGTLSCNLDITDTSNTQIARLGGVSGVPQYTVVGGSKTLLFKAGDQFKIRVVITGTTPSVYGDTTSGISTLNVKRISGPAQIAASDSVNARAYLSANQTGVNTNNSFVKITFDSTTFDSNGSWLSNKFTCPVAGKYSVDAATVINATNVLANAYALAIYKTGVMVSYVQPTQTAAGVALGLTIKDTLRCVAGDYIEIYVYGAGNNSVSTLSLLGGSAYSYVNIAKIGNY